MANYCANCGNKIENNAKFCPKCGKQTVEETNNLQNNQPQNYTTTTTNTNSKSRIAAGILGIILGSLGIHNFYLGYTNKGIAQLLLTLIGGLLCGIGAMASAIWGLIEGIQILTGSINTDANGTPLSD